MAFAEVWKTLPIPGEYDAMDDCDKSRWRGVIESAYNIGREQQKQKDAEIVLAEAVMDTGSEGDRAYNLALQHASQAVLKGDE